MVSPHLSTNDKHALKPQHSATERELNAIESENAKNLQSDGFRTYQARSSSFTHARLLVKRGVLCFASPSLRTDRWMALLFLKKRVRN